MRTITADNGTEFHGYAAIEQATPARFSMAHLTQQDCDRIAATLNHRPRKRLGYRTPEECYV